MPAAAGPRAWPPPPRHCHLAPYRSGLSRPASHHDTPQHDTAQHTAGERRMVLRTRARALYVCLCREGLCGITVVGRVTAALDSPEPLSLLLLLLLQARTSASNSEALPHCDGMTAPHNLLRTVTSLLSRVCATSSSEGRRSQKPPPVLLRPVPTASEEEGETKEYSVR